MPPSTTGVIILSHGHWFAEIAGIPLLHRVLLSSHKAGVRRWLVLTQHEAQWVHASLVTAYKLREVTWQVYDLQATDPGSLIAALPTDDVLVVTSPAVFDHRLLADLQEAVSPALCVTTAVGTTPAEIVVQDSLVVARTRQGAPALRSTGILRCSGPALGPGPRSRAAPAPGLAGHVPVALAPCGGASRAHGHDTGAGAGRQPASVGTHYRSARYQCDCRRNAALAQPGARRGQCAGAGAGPAPLPGTHQAAHAYPGDTESDYPVVRCHWPQWRFLASATITASPGAGKPVIPALHHYRRL